MLNGYWLLSDLDGTLVSTPHKAQGRYLPLHKSPCLVSLQRWLLNGGSLCIVTTADQRVFEQVYFPLRRTLRLIEERHQQEAPAATASTASAASNGPHRCGRGIVQKIVEENSTSTVSSSSAAAAASDAAAGAGAARAPTRGGKLLLSLYTGAVLYECTGSGIRMVPGYVEGVHRATAESYQLSLAYKLEMPTLLVCNPFSSDPTELRERMCVEGTCMSREVCDSLQAISTTIYEGYMRDILKGQSVVLQGLRRMSRRYKRMWKEVLEFLDGVYHLSNGRVPPAPAAKDDDSILYIGASQPPEAVDWKLKYLSTRTYLLEALGILRVEYMEAVIAFGDEGTQAQRQQTDTAFVVSHIMSVLTENLRPELVRVMEPLAHGFAQRMTRLLGIEARDLRKRQEGADGAPNFPDVAQIIVLGMPLVLFSRYFASRAKTFFTAGVSALPQPNSVVFSKMGVSKSTALRYLLGKDRFVEDVPTTDAATKASAAPAVEEVAPAGYVGLLQPGRAIALGDNPQSTDYELTVFLEVPFVSVEKQEQRTERHQRIARRLARAKSYEEMRTPLFLPDGTVAPSHAQLLASLHKSGSMMDDRLKKNIFYVGAEEDGTAAALATFMDELGVPSVASRHPQRRELREQLGKRVGPVAPVRAAEAFVVSVEKARKKVGSAPIPSKL